MHCQVKAFIDLTGFALVTAAKDDPFDHRLAVQPAGLSVMQSNDTPLGVPPADTRPYKSIDLTNIIPALDASGNRRSCPVGTINDGTGCVFPYSSVCPKDTRLEGNNCISEKSPQCPEGLAYDGTNCVGKPPTCPSGSKFNGEACESEVMPLCDAHFAFKDGACVYDKTPVCLPSFHPKGRFCTSNITSHSMAECVSTLNILLSARNDLE
ncbi:hypothetical protein NW766_012784 [Fusarium irregulare]|uniref:Uncharacterized protein n=1 Tax=Fusarium irregulare TaxID=2494466 RepID=A0A9W8PCZ4_9HYPO|nr:hypothetical protein NW766_012784 [Fusarium irregulare]